MSKQTKNQSPLKNMNRRSFIGTLGLGFALPQIVSPRLLYGQSKPSERVTLSYIGMGKQGTTTNMNFLRRDDTHIVAVCDCDLRRAKAAKELVDNNSRTKDCVYYQDFRELLARPDIDAVVISTPDHWHVPMSLAALQAGKDVFCEKPTLTINEGRELVNAFNASDRIFQWGMEDRALTRYYKLCEWAVNGALGDVQLIDMDFKGAKNFPAEDPVEPPEELDWNLWLGPAPYHDYSPNRTEWLHWREIFDYAGGAITDMGAHYFDIALIAAGMEDGGPAEIEGAGEIPEGRMTDVPVKYQLAYKLPNGVEMTVKSAGRYRIRVVGSKGWVQIAGRSGAFETSDPQILRVKYDQGQSQLWPQPKGEHENFIAAVKARSKDTMYHPETLHRVSTVAHLGRMAIRAGRKLHWDPATERLKESDVNLGLMDRPARDWASAAT
jgi:predicted dehydrogenase